jgi:hypothetical protein
MSSKSDVEDILMELRDARVGWKKHEVHEGDLIEIEGRLQKAEDRYKKMMTDEDEDLESLHKKYLEGRESDMEPDEESLNA